MTFKKKTFCRFGPKMVSVKLMYKKNPNLSLFLISKGYTKLFFPKSAKMYLQAHKTLKFHVWFPRKILKLVTGGSPSYFFNRDYSQNIVKQEIFLRFKISNIFSQNSITLYLFNIFSWDLKSVKGLLKVLFFENKSYQILNLKKNIWRGGEINNLVLKVPIKFYCITNLLLHSYGANRRKIF